MHEQAFKTHVAVFGHMHPQVAMTLGNISTVYQEQGKFPEALDTLKKVLAVFEKVRGRNHPVMATAHQNIGVVYFKQGNLPDALESFEKALAIEEKTFGCEHPDVATTYMK